MQAIEALIEAQAEEAGSIASLGAPAEISAKCPAEQGTPFAQEAVVQESDAAKSHSEVLHASNAQTAAESSAEAREGSCNGDLSDKEQGWSLVTSVKDKLPSRRRPCICGSGKRYKSCCGVPKGAAARRKKSQQEGLEHVQTGVAVPMSNLYI